MYEAHGIWGTSYRGEARLDWVGGGVGIVGYIGAEVGRNFNASARRGK